MIYLSRNLLKALLDCLIISCLRCLLGNETVICDRPATILGQAESTSMLSCDNSRKSLSTSIQQSSGAFLRIWVGEINPLLGGGACEALPLWCWTFFDQAGLFICAPTTWHCDIVCDIVMSWFMVVFQVWK